MSGTRIQSGMRKAMVVMTLAVATTGIGIGVSASPASAARSEACVRYINSFPWIRSQFMAAYEAHNTLEMDYWLRVYEDAIAGAEAAC